MASQDLISVRTRNAFRERLTGWTLREIDDLFQAAGLHMDPFYDSPKQGERRRLVEQYYHAIDFSDWRDAHKLLQVFESVLDPLDEDGRSQLLIDLSRDGYEYREHRIHPKAGRVALQGIRQHADGLEADVIITQIARIEASIEQDPSLAIGSAKELVETCCKTILTEYGKGCESDVDLPKLVKLTLESLHLTPELSGKVREDSERGRKAADSMRRMLQNLAGVVGCLAELRNLVGSGHGPEGRAKGPTPRHARLAVGAASTLLTFMLDTHGDRAKGTGT